LTTSKSSLRISAPRHLCRETSAVDLTQTELTSHCSVFSVVVVVGDVAGDCRWKASSLHPAEPSANKSPIH